jgi:hypothetical protein
MNRKGFLLGEETLKIILAVIAIGFLIYFLGSLYYNSVRDKKVDVAKSSLEHLINEINSGSTEIEIYNPAGWSIFNWKNDDSYLCICESESNCDPGDTCLKPNEKIEVSGYSGLGIIVIDNPPITLNLKEGVLSRK